MVDGTGQRPTDEIVSPDEARYTDQLTAMLLAKVQRDYPVGVTRRDAHAKHHGCVRAEFVVEPDLHTSGASACSKRPARFRH